MCKKNLQVDMTNAVEIYRDMLAREMRGPSDTEAAMWRLQARHGIEYGWQWAWRFRPPKATRPEVMSVLRTAYLNMIEASVRRDVARLEIEIAKGSSNAVDESLLAEAKDLLARIAQRRAS
jgi:hypothetical protein